MVEFSALVVPQCLVPSTSTLAFRRLSLSYYHDLYISGIFLEDPFASFSFQYLSLSYSPDLYLSGKVLDSPYEILA